MKANFHTHTIRCHHATGSEREYIEEALKGGLKVLGFSDHTPYVFKDGYYSHFRMRPEELPSYVETLISLKEEFKNQIEIHIGLETEYYEEFFSEYLQMIQHQQVEYLILGQHFPEREMGEIGCVRPSDNKEELKKYVRSVCRAIKTDLFSYVAHPDVFNYVGDDEAFYLSEMEKIILTAKECNVPLEYNLLGQREQRPYPSERFFKLVGQWDVPVILGSDAHRPEDVAVQKDAENALAFLQNCNVKNIVETIDTDRLKRHGLY